MASSLLGLLALVSTVLAQTQDCTLTVPNNPLTAEGLATPYLISGCDQTQFADEACFVEAAILDPATGDIQIYAPLIVNQDAAVPGVDFIPPVVPTLPANAVVGIFFGSNAVTLTLAGDTNTCVNGDGNSIFGQFAYCNTPAFFTAAFEAVSQGLLTIPPPGQTTKASTVQPCPVTRDFRMVDMDQSDNVDSSYLLINGTILAQNTAENAAKYTNATEFNNGSDNLLLNAFLSPTLGCTPFTAPSITTPSGFSSAMALNELQSQFYVPAGGPALVPLNDDFAVIDQNGIGDVGNLGTITQSLIKTNLYRAGVGQPQAADIANASGVTYCQRYAASGIFIALNEELFSGATSPAPGASSNLFTFLANRFATSFGPAPSLGCQTIFGLAESPVNQTTNGDCIVVAATINTTVLQDILDGVILPVNSTSTTSSTSTVSSTTTSLAFTSFSNTSTTTASSASLVVNVVTTADTTTSTTASTTAATTSTTSLSTTTSTTSTTTVVIEVISFFFFEASLGGTPPGVTGSLGEFLVLEEVFEDLPSAAGSACTHQFNSCASFAGTAFSGTDCLSQLNSCNGVASTASPTASTPGTTTATATVPASAASSVAASATAAVEAVVTGAGSASDAACPAAVTVTSVSVSTVVASGSPGPVSATAGGRRHHYQRKPRDAAPPRATPHWRA